MEPIRGAEQPVERRAFLLGFLTNALNPKATLFFISLFVLVVSPQTPKVIQAGYGLWMAVATAAWFTLVSAVFTRSTCGKSSCGTDTGSTAHWEWFSWPLR